MIRLAVFGLACAAVLYACLAPTDRLPEVSVWDKAQHALTWAALTGLGLALWPRRVWRVAAFTLALGAAVEALQATMALGRTGDALDLAADALGVATALAAAMAAGRLLGRRGRG